MGILTKFNDNMKKYVGGIQKNPTPLLNYIAKQKAQTGDGKAQGYLDSMGKPTNLTDDPGYQKAQAERGEAIKGQFAAAKTGLAQREGQVKEDISSGLQRLQARVGAVGGSVEKARAKALQETGREFSGQYQELAANEAAALSGLKGEDVQRKYESDAMNKQMDQQNKQFAASFGLNVDQFNAAKDQFAKGMEFQYKELDENMRTNILNAMMAMKKANLDAKQISKYFDEVTGMYGEGRTQGLKPVTKGYDALLQDQRKRYGISGTPSNIPWENERI